MPAHPPLPTVEQCREFLRLVNVGRIAAGLDPLERLDFDHATPSCSRDCLSATNLFHTGDLNGFVGTCTVEVHVADGPMARVAVALGLTDAPPFFATMARAWTIPDAILAVTDPFDDEVDGLRERMAEAGVI